jgi:hypothetical protein
MSIIYEAVKKIEEKEKPFPKKKRKNKKIVFLILILFAFGFYFFFSKKSFQEKSVYSSKKITSKDKIVKKESKQKYRLEGIIYTPQNPIALINGKRVKIGEEFDGLKVIEISEKQVQLKTEEGGVIYLSLE